MKKMKKEINPTIHLIRKEKIREYKRKYSAKIRERRKRLGLCIRCGKPRIKNSVFCLECLYYVNEKTKEIKRLKWDKILEYAKERKKKYFLEGRCTKCGSKLNEDIDKGKITCFNCRRNVIKIKGVS